MAFWKSGLLGFVLVARGFFSGDPVPFVRPSAEIDHLAALGAKRAIRVAGKGRFLAAVRTFDGLYGAHLVPLQTNTSSAYALEGR